VLPIQSAELLPSFVAWAKCLLSLCVPRSARPHCNVLQAIGVEHYPRLLSYRGETVLEKAPSIGHIALANDAMMPASGGEKIVNRFVLRTPIVPNGDAVGLPVEATGKFGCCRVGV